VRSLLWSPDGGFLFSGGKDNLIRVFETSGFRETAQLIGHPSQVRCLSVSPDGKRLVSTALDEIICLWQRGPKGWQDAVSKPLEGHSAMVENAVFSPDGNTILSAGEDGKVLRWTAEGELEKELFSNRGNDDTKVYNQTGKIAFSPSGKTIAVAESILKVQDPKNQLFFNISLLDETGKQKTVFTLHKQTIFQIQFIDENNIISSDGINNIFIWNTDSTVRLPLLAPKAMVPMVAFAENLQVDFSLTSEISNGYQLNHSFDWAALKLTSGIDNRKPERLSLIERSGNKLLSIIDGYHLATGTGAVITSELAREGSIRCFTFTPDDKILVLFEKALCLYNSEGQLLRNFESIGTGNRGLALSPDGQFAVVSTLTTGQQQLWHVPSGSLCATLFIRPTDGAWVCWSPQGWFEASPEGVKMLEWYTPLGADFFQKTESQTLLRKKFNRPDLLKKSILVRQKVSSPIIKAPQPAKPELILSAGHGTAIEEVAFSPDGTHIATAGDDNFIKIWDLQTGKLLTNILNCDERSTSGSKTVQFSLDGRSVLTVKSSSDALCLYDVYTGERLVEIQDSNGSLTKARFSPDETQAITTSNPLKAVKIWSLLPGKRGKVADLLGVESIADDAAFTPDGKYIIAVCRDRKVLFWDAKTFEPIRHQALTLPLGKRENLNSLELRISPDSRFFAVADGEAGIIWLGDCTGAQNPEPIRKAAANQIASAIDFSPDSRYLAISGIGLPFEIIETTTRSTVKTFANDLWAQSLAFSPDGQSIAMVSGILHEFAIELWSIATGKVISELNRTVPISKCVALSRSGRLLATGNTNNNVNLWDLTYGRFLFDLEGTPEESHYDFGIQAIRFSADEHFVAAASADGMVYLWQTATGKLLHRFEGHTDMVSCLDFSPDGTLLASGDLEKNVLLWDVVSGKPLRFLPQHNAPVTTICFSPDSRKVAYGNFDTLRVCDQEGHELAVFSPNLRDLIQAGFVDSLRKTMDIGNINKDLNPEANEIWVRKISIVFDPDNLTILFAGGDDCQIGRFDLETKKKSFLKKPTKVFTPVTTMAASPDGKYLALGLRQSGYVDVFEARTGDLLRSIPAHKTTPFGLAFAQDGERSLLATCADDSYVKLFDWKNSGNELTAFVADREGRFTIVSPDNYHFNDRTGASSMAYKLNGQIFPFEQFDLRFNRPDRILDRIGFASPELVDAYRGAWKKRLDKMGFCESDLSDELNLPNLKIANRAALPLTTKQNTLSLQVNVSYNKPNLDRLNVFVNDVPIYGIAGINLRPKNTQQHEQAIDIELVPGENKIQVSVLNQAGAESLKETFYVTCTAPPRKPDLYFIGIGSGQFQNKAMNLDFPAKDVRDFAAIWAKNNDVYGRILIDTLLDKYVTRTNIAALKQKLLQTKVDDQVVLFVAGHGILDDSLDYYLAAYNTDFKQPQNGSIPYDLLDNLLDAIPARQKLMLMDACHAGEIDKESVMPAIEQRSIKGTVKFRSVGADIAPKKLGLENSFELMKELFVDLRRGTGATVIASSGGVEAAMEGTQWNNSVFMYALLSGLQEKKADLNKDGAVMVSELQNYLGAEVQKLTGGAQRPVSRVENIENDWRVW
jgi:WD40 repeat protein